MVTHPMPRAQLQRNTTNDDHIRNALSTCFISNRQPPVDPPAFSPVDLHPIAQMIQDLVADAALPLNQELQVLPPRTVRVR